VGPWRGRGDGGGALDLLAGRHLRLGRRGAEQTPEGDAEGQGRRPHGGAEESRRVAEEGEVPPQVVRVADVLVGEEAQPESAEDDDGDGRAPARRERLGGERSLAVEMPVAGSEGGEHDGEDEGLLPVEAFGE